jgi:hypothetical protein
VPTAIYDLDNSEELRAAARFINPAISHATGTAGGPCNDPRLVRTQSGHLRSTGAADGPTEHGPAACARRRDRQDYSQQILVTGQR